jgi:transmembrane sensor
VHVKFAPATREITLVRGEALFSVAKNPHRPFIVTARHISVSAVGTAFEVRYQGANVEVLVTEGKVDVRSSAAPPAAAAPATAPVRVAAGERLVVAAPGGAGTPPTVEKMEPVSSRESLAWQAQHFVFVDTPLSEVAAEFNRRNRIQLEIRDPSLAGRLVGGNFRADNVETFVRLLEGNHDIAVERPDGEHIILRSAR